MWVWLKDKWNKFQDWVASWMPGFKTQLVAGIGIVGSLAGMLQEYISGMPLGQFMTATQITVVTMVLFTLTFWFRQLANRE